MKYSDSQKLKQKWAQKIIFGQKLIRFFWQNRFLAENLFISPFNSLVAQKNSQKAYKKLFCGQLNIDFFAVQNLFIFCQII